VQCPLCAAPTAAPAFWKDGFPIARCGCGMIYVAKSLDGAVLDDLYGERYFAGGFDGVVPGYRGYGNEEPVMRRNFDRRLAFMERLVRPGPLLDVGCALGFFVRAARARGWDARGVELSGFAAREASAAGVPVVQGDFLTLDLAPRSLAAVTMLDMLEHVADPRAYVRRARGVLAPGGLLVVETADLGSAVARLSGRHYHFFTPPNHLTYFTRATLGRLLNEEGFADVSYFRVGKWVTVRRLLYHSYVRVRRRALARMIDLAEKSGMASLALPVNLGDDLLVIGRVAA